MVSATLPAAHAETISLIGIPASAKATAAASKAAHLDPPSAWRISIKTSTTVLGKLSSITAGSRASLITLEISISLLDGAGFFLSPTENGCM